MELSDFWKIFTCLKICYSVVYTTVNSVPANTSIRMNEYLIQHPKYESEMLQAHTLNKERTWFIFKILIQTIRNITGMTQEWHKLLRKTTNATTLFLWLFTKLWVLSSNYHTYHPSCEREVLTKSILIAQLEAPQEEWFHHFVFGAVVTK